MEIDYLNHRQRLKQRYLKGGRKALADYEILELLLTFAIPRVDVKPRAKNLIKKSGSLKKVFDKELEELKNFEGIGENSALLIKLLKDIMLEYFEPENNKKIILSSPKAVEEYLKDNFYNDSNIIPYLKAELGGKSREFFMLLCLNSLNHIIHKETLFLGTLDQAQVYPREIIKIALLKNASAIILIHNHPSGNAKPSMDDIRLTDKIEEIASEFSIRVHDHIVVASENTFSIKANRFLDFKLAN
ncbi:MAG: DNA repair protein RadC [Candidatus Sericytochromatia bacterium]